MMKLFSSGKDGGQDSNVTGYWLIEWKSVFSVALLKFERGSREAFHSHAFNSVSWVLFGHIIEDRISTNKAGVSWSVMSSFRPSLKPIITTRDNLHKVHGCAKVSWLLTFRGPWHKTWQERLKDNSTVTLTHGRHIIGESK